jgi:16S rRNA (adenine1518-N6/adenine1519-N6)-dimethyltransferase
MPAKKRFGQHFLHDPAVIAKIVAAIAPAAGDRIVEIGGGHGALTRPLAATGIASLDVIEVDRGLAAELGGLDPGPTGLTVHEADALKFDFAPLAPAGEQLRLVGNLPYNISTPLLFHALAARGLFRDWHVMLQKEVVERMIAAPGSKRYGRLTVMLAAWTDIERCFDIGPGAFAPPPKVWSSFVRVTPRDEPKFVIGDQAKFASLVARLFSMRRKTIARSLKGLLEPEQIAGLGLDPRARPEELAPGDFARLADSTG